MKKFGIENGILREPARVIMHLPESWTRILLTRTYVPTAKIPEHLRTINSVFVVETRVPYIFIEDSEERYGRRCEDLIITELPAEELH